MTNPKVPSAKETYRKFQSIYNIVQKFESYGGTMQPTTQACLGTALDQLEPAFTEYHEELRFHKDLPEQIAYVRNALQAQHRATLEDALFMRVNLKRR